MKKAQLIAGLMFLAASIYIVVVALGMKYYDAIGPGAGFFPFWLGLFLGFLSLACLVQVWRDGRDDSVERFLPNRQGMVKIALIIVALLSFVVLLNPIGFKIAMFGFLFFLLALLGRQKILISIVIATLGSFGAYHAFNNWLGVPLPLASLEWLQYLNL